MVHQVLLDQVDQVDQVVLQEQVDLRVIMVHQVLLDQVDQVVLQEQVDLLVRQV
jgi:hypothetical protein